ncbi:hypothetical protein D3C87_1483640 [compost metagenome]
MPCVLSDDTRGKRVIGIGSADQVLDEKLPACCMGEHIGLQNGKMLRRHGLVIIPPDLVFGHGIAHDELVLRRAAGVLASDSAQRAIGGQIGLAAANGFFVKLDLRQVVVDARNLIEADRCYAICRVIKSKLLHTRSPQVTIDGIGIEA